MDYTSLPWMSLPSLLSPASASAFEPFFDAFNPSSASSAPFSLSPAELSSSSPSTSGDPKGVEAVVPASTIAPVALGSTDSAPFSSALSASLAASSSSSSYPVLSPSAADDDAAAAAAAAYDDARRASSASSRSSRATSPPPPKRAPEPSHAAPAAKRVRPNAGEQASKSSSKRRPRKMTDKRREQNRLAQKNLRARRAAQYEEYHDRAESLEKENSELRALISALRSENGSLRALVPQEFQSALISIPSAQDSDHTADYYSTDDAGSPFSAYL